MHTYILLYQKATIFLCVSYNKSVISIWWFFCSCSSLPYNIVIEWRNASWIYRHVIEERTNDAWLPMPVIVTFDLICLWKDLPPVNTISPGTYYVGQNTLSRKFANDSRYHVPPFHAYHSHFQVSNAKKKPKLSLPLQSHYLC